MPRKVKLEIEMEDGTKIRIEIPNGDRSKVEDFLKLLELYSSKEEYNLLDNSDTLYKKLYDVIVKEFGFSFFTLGDLYRTYLIKYGEEIKKSTLSTYLSRMVRGGILRKFGERGKYRFRLIEVPKIVY